MRWHFLQTEFSRLEAATALLTKTMLIALERFAFLKNAEERARVSARDSRACGSLFAGASEALPEVTASVVFPYRQGKGDN